MKLCTYLYQFGGEDKNGIIHLHINYLICTKSILGQNLGKFGQLLRNDQAEFHNSFKVVVQQASYLHVN
jgi:hypothetical protein